ncbi:ABC transporter permease [Actinokineospora sp. UTMC 2448]|uniref:ABC transporter permease n=1 Tax=Actinokineospora sp. UTMC 2448 TaxID=2268449 RepID=UPI002164AE76|nr:ABC transporter permease [Actinokineospora sp. UTMC 2448]UVS78660.1 ABC-2 family transporter protein [Actinokineospora sp. UTMC 2448]
MRTIRSEWTKLRGLRSTWITAASTVGSGAALGVLGAADLTAPPEDWDPTAASLKGFLFAQLVIGMLGALSVTPEYATGTIGTSLAAVPARSRLLAAKAAVVAAIAVATGLATTLVSFAAVQLMLDGAGLPPATLADPGVPRALVGGTLYLAIIALIGVAVGALTRSTTSSLAVLVGALLLVPALAPGLPAPLGDWLARHWPITAGQAVYTVVPTDGALTPWLGLAILAAAAAAISTASHAALHTRDA